MDVHSLPTLNDEREKAKGNTDSRSPTAVQVAGRALGRRRALRPALGHCSLTAMSAYITWRDSMRRPSNGFGFLVVTGVLYATIAVAMICAYASCAPLTVEVELDQIDRVIDEYQSGDLVVVNDDISIVVDEQRSPQLRLEFDRGCGLGEMVFENCRDWLDGDLSTAVWKGDAVSLAVYAEDQAPSPQRQSVAVAQIEGASVLLNEYSADDWERHWGLGLSMLGSSGMMAFDVQYLPRDFFAFELGFFGGPHAGSAYAGMRYRFAHWGPVRPYLGAAANAVFFGSPEPDETFRQAAIGPKLGLDFEFGRGHWLIGVEGLALYLLNEEETWVADLEGPWVPWGGARVAYMF